MTRGTYLTIRRALRRGPAAGVALIGLALGVPGAADAAAGELDPTFAGGRLALRAMGQSPLEATAFGGTALGPRGSVAVVGGVEPARFGRWSSAGRSEVFRSLPRPSLRTLLPAATTRRSDGVLVAAGTTFAGVEGDQLAMAAGAITFSGRAVTGFGDRGLARLPALPGARYAQARAVVAQPRRKVVLGGFAAVDGRMRFALARLGPDGRLDPTFGSGGVTTTALPGTGESAPEDGPPYPPCTTIADLAVQPDGRLLAAGTECDSSRRSSRIAVARYLPDGALDTTFAHGAGVATLGLPGRALAAGQAVAIQPPRARSGFRILVAGRTARTANAPAEVALIALRPDGAIDLSFAGSGIRLQPLGHTGAQDIAVSRDGRFAISGATPTSLFLQRYRADGKLAAWGAAGTTCTDVPARLDEPETTSIRGLPDGRVVVGAAGMVGGDNPVWMLGRYRRAFRTPLDCFSIDLESAGPAVVTFALGRAGRVVLDVYRRSGAGRRLVGRASLGSHGRGVHRLRWDRRVRGRRIGSRHETVLRVLDRRGRAIASSPG